MASGGVRVYSKPLIGPFQPARSCWKTSRASSRLLGITQGERSEKRSKKQFDSTQLESTSFRSTGSVHSMHGFTLVYIYS